MIKVLTIVGARPQLIKAAVVSRVIQSDHNDSVREVIVHTGQHFDHNMSSIFFEELGIYDPKYNLGISGGSHGEMTGRMLSALDPIIVTEMPDFVLVYGDTNSTLAGALSAVKLHVPVIHVEAGLRSFNTRMPEEINRVVTDRVSALLFCPTRRAVDNLSREGICAGVHQVGDVMLDASIYFREKAIKNSKILNNLGLRHKGFVLATIHRAENTNNLERLKKILDGFSIIAKRFPVVFPLHPRTRDAILSSGFMNKIDSLHIIPPVSFFDIICLQNASCAILTDSGGIQKEAFFLSVPCVTLRDETEWPETVDLGWNQLVGASSEMMVNAVEGFLQNSPLVRNSFPYGNGDAAKKIVETILHS